MDIWQLCALGLIAVLSGVIVFLFFQLGRERKAVREQELQLQEARRQEALGTLAGGIAHDFNNILGSVLGFGSLLEEDLMSQPQLRELATQIVVAARRGQEIVSQLMRYTRRTMEESDSSRKPVDLDHIIHESIHLLKPSIRSSTTIDYQNKLFGLVPDVSIQADATQIEQALVNLCINADHAIGVKVGKIHIVLDQVWVRRESGATAALRVSGGQDIGQPVKIINGRLKPGQYFKISVSDDGEGMTKEVAERIFDPFFTTKGVDLGTGLGLPAIQGIVHSHGGAIVVKTKRFHGTTFELLFPCADAMSQAERAVA